MLSFEEEIQKLKIDYNASKKNKKRLEEQKEFAISKKQKFKKKLKK